MKWQDNDSPGELCADGIDQHLYRIVPDDGRYRLKSEFIGRYIGDRTEFLDTDEPCGSCGDAIKLAAILEDERAVHVNHRIRASHRKVDH